MTDHATAAAPHVTRATQHATRPTHQTPLLSGPSTINHQPSTLQVSLLTAGYDKPYALGIAAALTAEGVRVDFIGGDDQDVPELRNNDRVRFLNLRDDALTASPLAKLLRVWKYYVRLAGYAARAKPRIFHILWHYRFILLNRTLFLLYYKLLGKRLVFTAHNVNAGKRDGNDSWLNRVTLRIQYWLVDHIFVHTAPMKRELGAEFGVPAEKVSVIPFGINNTVPNTALTTAEAREKLGLRDQDRVLLFFGNILAYKGLAYLVDAFAELVGNPKSEIRNPKQIQIDGNEQNRALSEASQHSTLNSQLAAPLRTPHSDDSQLSTLNSQLTGPFRLIIVGKPKEGDGCWGEVQKHIARSGVGDRIIQRIEYVPDEETELFFKAADVLVLPYLHIFQSGVLFLGYSFGLPVIATDVGSLKEEIIEGETGFMCRPADAADLARAIEKYFASALFRELPQRRTAIRDYANQRYSWTPVGQATARVYRELMVDG